MSVNRWKTNRWRYTHCFSYDKASVDDLRGTEPRFSLKESTLSPGKSAGLQEMRTRNHHKSTGKGWKIWKCILILFVGVQFWWKISFGEGHPRRICRLKTHKAAFFGRGSPGPAAVGEEFGPKFQAHLVHVNMVVFTREYCIILWYILSYAFMCWITFGKH